MLSHLLSIIQNPDLGHDLVVLVLISIGVIGCFAGALRAQHMGGRIGWMAGAFLSVMLGVATIAPLFGRKRKKP